MTQDSIGADPATQGDPTTRKLLSLYRKFLWVNELYARYRAALRREGSFMSRALETKEIGSFEEGFRSEMYLCLSFSTLYIVIKGWPALQRGDADLTVSLSRLTLSRIAQVASTASATR